MSIPNTTSPNYTVSHNHISRRETLQGEKTKTQMGVSPGDEVTFSFPSEETTGATVVWDFTKHWNLQNLQAFPTGHPEEISRPGVGNSNTTRPGVVQYISEGPYQCKGVPAAQTLDNYEVSIPTTANGQTFRLTFTNEAEQFLIADMIVGGKYPQC